MAKKTDEISFLDSVPFSGTIQPMNFELRARRNHFLFHLRMDE
jgi:hypothetical protein